MSTATATNNASVELVRSIFEAFGRRDIAYILSCLSPDCAWVCPGEGLPYAGSYTGPQGAADFFQKLAANEEVTLFEPREYFTSGEDVVAVGYEEGRALGTGRGAASNWAMLFHVRDGKVTRWQHHFDTGGYLRAHQGLQ